MTNEKTDYPYTPINSFETDEPRPEGVVSPNVAVAEGVIEEGIRESVMNGESTVKVTVDGKRIFLGTYLAKNLYQMDLNAEEIENIFDRYLGVRIVGGEAVYGKNPNAALGNGAVKAVRDYDFRERQSGEYLDK